MTHIKDGLIALTSDNKIYIALLDYDKLHSNTFNVIDDETQNHFASIVKVIDLPTHWSHNKA
jgi:DNA-binding beta-propeller fold protein YncE